MFPSAASERWITVTYSYCFHAAPQAFLKELHCLITFASKPVCAAPKVSCFVFLSPDKPCELFCSPLGKDSPVLVADRVLDGTPCGPYETDLCVHGKCQVE